MTIVVRPQTIAQHHPSRLYTLKDKKHAMYEDDAAEQKALFKDFSADDKLVAIIMATTSSIRIWLTKIRILTKSF